MALQSHKNTQLESLVWQVTTALAAQSRRAAKDIQREGPSDKVTTKVRAAHQLGRQGKEKEKEKKKEEAVM